MAAATDERPAGPTRGAERFEGVHRWSAHPLLARLTRFAVYAVPLLTALTSGWIVGRQSVTHSWPAAVRWLVMSAVATGVLVVVERGARRVMPLCGLLNLSLVFPDRAPSRFAVALRAGSTRQLESRVRATPEDGSADAAAKILAQVMALHAHDRRTRGHSERVRAFAVLIGKEMGLASDELDKLQWAALLHDVGKLEVPASILNKDGRPTDDEWKILAGHPANGEHLIAPLAPWLGEWVGAVTEHHERWDGAGYPHGLQGHGISLAGRIVAVADAFEVMTAARSYKKPLSIAAARAELTRCAGKQFDPTVVRVFLNVSIGRVRRLLSPLAWTGQLPFIPVGVAIPAPGAVAASGALVGGLLLGPAVTPFFGGVASANEADTSVGSPANDNAAPTPGEPIEPAGRAMDSDAVRLGSADPRGASTPAASAAPPPTTGQPTVTHPKPSLEPPPTPLTDEVLPPLVGTVDSLLSPVVDSTVTPLVDPLVGSVVDPLLGPVVDPLLGSLLPPTNR